MYSQRHSEPATLTREVLATQIPSGEKQVLPTGASVVILQSLGGNVTVMAPSGQMVRIDEKDLDALGEEFAAAAAAEKASAEAARSGPATEGEFDMEQVWEQLKTVYDPEIPVNIVDLGLVYTCDATDRPEGGKKVDIKMTMTAPGCGMGGVLKDDVERKVRALPGVGAVNVDVVWDPPWDQSRMTDVARLQLGWM
ncbi:MAG TPA: putative Fe-S cluster assembly protein SufT [Myxococcales bacterium]|nr:putative Fe-S cluster assembly protein SufT [Myxococcales bacterium]